MSQTQLWQRLRQRFRAWTGNLLSVTTSAAALEALAELSAQRRMSPDRFLDYAETSPNDKRALLERLLIRTTWFMREPDAITALANAFKRRGVGRGPLRATVWSVACSTGEEPYSLAMAFLEAGIDPIILATDISEEARDVAASGEYAPERLDELPSRWRQRFFVPGTRGRMRVAPAVRSVVSFVAHNVAQSTRPPSGWASFDAIVCRNMLLYFDRAEAARILKELGESCRPDGYILLGAAEHPLAWSVGNLTWERSDEVPFLRRRPPASATPVSGAPLSSRDGVSPRRPSESSDGLAEARARLDEWTGAGSTTVNRTRSGDTGEVRLRGDEWASSPATSAGAPARVDEWASSPTTTTRGRLDEWAAPATVTSAAPMRPRLVDDTDVRQRVADANAAFRRGDAAGATRLLETLLLSHPQAAPAHLALGLLHKSAGRIPEATLALRQARFLFGDESWLAPYTLAVCLEARRELQEALDNYRHAAAVIEFGGPSGLIEPEADEELLARTVLESCRRRLGSLPHP